MLTTYHRILALLRNSKISKGLTAKELRENLGVSESLIHRQLKRLLAEQKITRKGAPPRVFYFLNSSKQAKLDFNSELVNTNWLEILPNGEFLYGAQGFIKWCENRHLSVAEMTAKYEKIFAENNSLKKDGLIKATDKITTSFTQNYLSELWYIDFYSWEIFGKTKLGKLILYAKQNSDKILMQKIAQIIAEPLQNFLQKEKFNLVTLIPHSIKRNRDFLKTTIACLPFILQHTEIFTKNFVDHIVAQKTLKSKADRQENAEKTIVLSNPDLLISSPKILLIDDACGSGSTLNISAQKIKEISPNSQVFGLTFVGSQKGFEVIKET